MNYAQFRDKAKSYPFFRSNSFEHWAANPAVLRRQVSEWVDKGYILQLRRGVYTLKKEDRTAAFSTYVLANTLYTPSYISLETALSYYGFIPERVYAITSISSKKTQTFTNSYGQFTYRHIKPIFYNGFITQKDEYGNNFFIATKEKALVDFFYLQARELKNYDETIFEQSYRLQNLEGVDCKKLLAIAQSFNQLKLTILIKSLIKYIKHYA
jgi:predicted transcriptional regulator of viral defense system